MTNFERYFSEIKEIAFSGNKIAKDDSGIRSCEGLGCIECDFLSEHARVPCSVLCTRWMCEEYIEPIKLTHKQLAILKILETGWLARNDSSNHLYWYSDKPKRSNWHFEKANTNSDTIKLLGMFDAFDFITFKDEPFSVEEMLKWEVLND